MEWSERIGRAGELMFAAEAISRGLTVLQPSGVHGYDWVVEYKGKYTKVQIKTTSVKNSGRRYAWNLTKKSSESDVFVMYVSNTNMFFMVRADDIPKNSKSFYVPLNKMESYEMNNWNIFK